MHKRLLALCLLLAGCNSANADAFLSGRGLSENRADGFWAMNTQTGYTAPAAPPIAGYSLWVAARAERIYSDGDPVGTITDWSGNGYNATQATASKKPLFKESIINGQPVYRFDGTDDVANGSNVAAMDTGQALTIYIVLDPSGSTICPLSKWEHGSQTSWAMQHGTGSQFYFANTTNDIGNTYKSITATVFPGGTDPGITTLVYDGTQATPASRLMFYHNNTTPAQSLTGTPATSMAGSSAIFRIGSFGGGLTRYFNGDIAEILVYQASHDAAQRTQIWNYLNGVYSIF